MVDRDDVSPDRLRLIELEVRERLERKLASRMRWTLGLFTLVFGALAILGYLSARNAIESATLEAARAEVERLEQTVRSSQPDVSAIRQEMREDTQFVRDQFIDGHADLQAEIRHASATADRIESASTSLDEETRELRVLRGGVTLLERTLASEVDRIKKLHERYATDLDKFTADSTRIMHASSAVINEQLASVGAVMQHELDEMRLVLADHAAGVPALFSTWLDLEQGKVRLDGTNFGADPGRVLVRVRVFGGGVSKELVGESESILMVAKSWSPSAIEIDMGKVLVTQLDEARTKALNGMPADHVIVRYGILVQTADGRLSHWSGASADSTLSGARGEVATN